MIQHLRFGLGSAPDQRYRDDSFTSLPLRPRPHGVSRANISRRVTRVCNASPGQEVSSRAVSDVQDGPVPNDSQSD
jgi:hypothetical protein